MTRQYSDPMDQGEEEIARLRRENDRLREEYHDLYEGRVRAGSSHRVRRTLSWILVVLACVFAAVSVLVIFVRNEVLNTSTYVSTVQPLAADPAIQAAVADTVSSRLVEGVDLRQRVTDALPAKASFLAAPITTGVQDAVRQATQAVVRSPEFQTLWAEANQRAHSQLVALLTGSGTGVLRSSQHGQVSLDLSQVANQVKHQLDQRGITIFDRVPTGKDTQLVLFQSDQLARAQRLVRLLDRLALFLPFAALALFAGAVFATTDRRRGLVRVAVGLAVTMVALLVGFDIGRNLYLHALGPSVSRAAAQSAYDVVTAVPLDTIRVILALSVVVAVIALLAGNRRLRHRLAGWGWPAWFVDNPGFRFIAGHRPTLQWGVAGIGALVLVTWSNPTPLVVVVVALITLAFVGLVGMVAGRRPQLRPRGNEATGAGTSGDVEPLDDPVALATSPVDVAAEAAEAGGTRQP